MKYKVRDKQVGEEEACQDFQKGPFNLELRRKLLLVFCMVSTVVKYKMLWCA